MWIREKNGQEIADKGQVKGLERRKRRDYRGGREKVLVRRKGIEIEEKEGKEI
jgi:hypothetical protein